MLTQIADGLAEGRLIPFLGPGILSLDGPAPVPDSPQALAAFFAARVALPKRVRGNVWATAQYIEGARHRQTVRALMREAFAPPLRPNALHRLMARARPPLVVSAWYDRALETALAGSVGWGGVAGTSRHGIGPAGSPDRWWKTCDAAGRAVPDEVADTWSTLVYRPHGAVEPDADMLVSDSDYVEVLTEIDIQTPIPPAVKERRTGRGFLFLGCRFDDQMLRIFARQIMKRSQAPHYAVLDGAPTRNEARFLTEQGITRIDASLADLVSALAGERV
ncbi:SIR2 family NAD-dependent protein deacylase [Rhodocista pekingensis]|uniref:SIR2 family protein n=1 Tax=Rhodocista pekingensis TaxID=201185 RepID=A0ABW2KNW4_9PROT